MIIPPDLATARHAAMKVAPFAQIEAIVLREVQWKAYEVVFDAAESIEVIPEYNMAHGRRDALVRYKVNTKLTGRVQAGEVFRLECTHDAYFTVDATRPFSEDELGAYGAVTVFFMVFPYIRQTLHELSGNAGLPAVLLKPYKLPVEPSATHAPSAEASLPPGPVSLDTLS